MEILAPAGSPERLYAALDAGCDAVYMGGQRFSARKFAGNFSDEEMKEAVRLCHVRGVAVYVTLNTLIGDREMKEAEEYIRFLDSIDIDGLLVQDMGIVSLARRIAPRIPLHASTQMTVSTLAGVRYLESLGFTRVVLSRELSLDEIKYIVDHCEAEIEIFVHGALCVCYSGQCLMSSFIGGRSGNRGACAQPCRMPYELTDDAGVPFKKGQGKYVLSLKDMLGLEDLEGLLQTGVASLKIEGRMKSPGYVYDVVSSYRKAIDTIQAGSKPSFDQLEEHMQKRFNRGYTRAYWEDHAGADMMTSYAPGNHGVLAGHIVSTKKHSFVFREEVPRDHAHVEGISYITADGHMAFVPQKDLRQEKGGSYSCIASLLPAKGSPVYWKYADEEMHFDPSHLGQRVPLSFEVWAEEGQPLRLEVSDGEGRNVSLTSEYICEKALRHITDQETVEKQLGRLGETSFTLHGVTLHNSSCLIPKSTLNHLRQEAVRQMEDRRAEDFVESMHPVLPDREPVVVSRQIRADKEPRIVVRTDNVETALAAIRGGAGEILFGGDSFHHLPVSVKEYETVRDACRAHGIPVTFATARVIREKQAEAYVRRLRPILELSPDAVQVEFPGMLMWLKDMAPELPVEGGSSLNVFNREALSFAEQTGFSSQYLSQELTIPQIRDIARSAEIPVGVYVYGRTEMMISEYCAIEAVMTGKSKKECPGMCMKHSYGLTDREGRRFPLRTDEWCRMHVLNSRILDMRPYLPDLVRAGVSRLCLDVRAWQGDTEALTRSFVRILTGEDMPPSPDADNESTRGHFFRGVL